MPNEYIENSIDWIELKKMVIDDYAEAIEKTGYNIINKYMLGNVHIIAKNEESFKYFYINLFILGIIISSIYSLFNSVASQFLLLLIQENISLPLPANGI